MGFLLGAGFGLDYVDGDSSAGAGDGLGERIEGGFESGDVLCPGDRVAGERNGYLYAEFVRHHAASLHMLSGLLSRRFARCSVAVAHRQFPGS